MRSHAQGELRPSGARAGDPRGEALAARVARARAGAQPLLDLTEADPARCDLCWDRDELRDILSAAREEPSRHGAREAQEAVAGYLAGRGAAVRPEQVVLAPSWEAALALALEAACAEGAEVPCPAPAFPLALPAGGPARPVPYALRYDGRWGIDRRSLGRAVTGRSGAVLVESPAEPTGACASADELAIVEALCRARGVALVADERFADDARAPLPTAAALQGCLALQLGSVAGACALPGTAPAWVAVAGPERLAGPALRRVEARAAGRPGVDPVAQRAMPSLLGRRERVLQALRARVARNRAALATAALREAPWTLLQGDGRWAVLELGEAQDEHALCLELLDHGVLVHPGYLCGFDRNGFVALSLLLPPDRLRAGLEILEERLRDRLFA